MELFITKMKTQKGIRKMFVIEEAWRALVLIPFEKGASFHFKTGPTLALLYKYKKVYSFLFSEAISSVSLAL